jgi:hypothetical protein
MWEVGILIDWVVGCCLEEVVVVVLSCLLWNDEWMYELLVELLIKMMMMMMIPIFQQSQHLIYILPHAHSYTEAHSKAGVKRQDIGCYTHYPSPKLTTG